MSDTVFKNDVPGDVIGEMDHKLDKIETLVGKGLSAIVFLLLMDTALLAIILSFVLWPK